MNVHSAALEALEMFDSLMEIFTVDEADAWVSTPHKLLGGLTPTECMKRGEYQKVKAVIEQLSTGAFV